MDNTALDNSYLPVNINPYPHLNRSGRPKGARNKKTVLLESFIVPEIVKRLESIPQSIRDKYKEALSYKGLETMHECIDKVETIEKPETKFNMAARLYDLTTPRQQNIQVDSRQTVIRSQDLLEGLKLLKSGGKGSGNDIDGSIDV